MTALESVGPVDGIILAVAHEPFKAFDAASLAQLCCNGEGCGVVVDVKGMLERADIEAAGLRYWSL